MMASRASPELLKSQRHMTSLVSKTQGCLCLQGKRAICAVGFQEPDIEELEKHALDQSLRFRISKVSRSKDDSSSLVIKFRRFGLGGRADDFARITFVLEMFNILAQRAWKCTASVNMTPSLQSDRIVFEKDGQHVEKRTWIGISLNNNRVLKLFGERCGFESEGNIAQDVMNKFSPCWKQCNISKRGCQFEFLKGTFQDSGPMGVKSTQCLLALTSSIEEAGYTICASPQIAQSSRSNTVLIAFRDETTVGRIVPTSPTITASEQSESDIGSRAGSGW